MGDAPVPGNNPGGDRVQECGPAGVYGANGSALAPTDDIPVDVEFSDFALEPGFSWKALLLHTGPGFLMCIAYIDPGNLEADLQTGALTGYTLLWVLLWSTACGYLLQSLACRLGVATGRHLAQHCAAQYPAPVRLVLWLMAELAIIGSDIQEVIGTAIALLLLTRGALPLWGGVVVAAVAAYVLLMLEKLGVRWLEASFQLMVGVMSVAMGALFFMADVPYAEVAEGLLFPRITVAALPTAAGLLGAILMPHNLFLHSALVHARPVGTPPDGSRRSRADSIRYYNIESALALGVTLFINTAVISVFARGFHGRRVSKDIGLENAGQYLGRRFGAHMEVIWAVGLLAAGQSSTMTGTYAGQFVMGGFLNLRVPPATRALITRAVAIAPTLLVALGAREDSTRLDVLNQALNILQAVQLPFAVVPLLTLTSSREVMGTAFANDRPTAAACWAIAAGIAAVNGGTAYQTAVQHLPAAGWAHAAFWAAVALYFALVTYLVVEPLLPAAWRKRRAAGGGGSGGVPSALREPLLPGSQDGGEARGPRPGSPPQGAPHRQPKLPSHPIAHFGST